jgi:hypothetical protein
LTALALLAFAVGIVAGANNAKQDVSAATGMIDAMNVGACTTTNSDVLDISDCKIGTDGMAGDGNTKAFFEGEELDEAIEVDELYATYAHDPKTAAEAPRGIVANGDLIKISIKDSGRDRRDPVLIAIEDENTVESGVFDAGDPVPVFKTMNGGSVLVDDYTSAPGNDGGSLKVVEDAVGAEDLKDLTLEDSYFSPTGPFDDSGTYRILFNAVNNGALKPIAEDGVVRFFGRIDDDDDGQETYGKFEDIGRYIKLDEDVIPGDDGGAPSMALNVSVPSGGGVDLQVVYYETSDVEDLVGGDSYVDSKTNRSKDVVYTKAEKEDNTALLVQAASDGNTATANLHLEETGRFDGVYEGFLRLTDADGDGSGEGTTAENWGVKVDDASDADAAGAAVLGVGNGPVVINYRDSDGKNRSLSIQIDIEPPVIDITSPVHGSRSDDEKPSFVGTFNDGDAGLAADTFQLYVDNDPTDNNDPPDNNAPPPATESKRVLNIPASVSGDADPISRRLEYKGYSDDIPKYGLIAPGEWKGPATDTPEAYKSVEADDYANGAPDGEFADEVEIDFDENTDDFEEFNHEIEFQALVRDLAGNVGFSDSDPANPRFINDLGEKAEGRNEPNVLGVFSRHVVWLDEVDPYIYADRTVTGFYGLDDDNDPVRDRSAVMVVFDNPVNASLIDVGTFTLAHDDGSEIGIADVMVKDGLVFLKLDEELASDARPNLSITEGREVEDLAGNILNSTEHLLKSNNGDRVNSIKVLDGILPVFTLELSGGSGTGAGSEGPAQLTKDAINIAIESDEDITGAPKVAVVCSNIKFNEGDDKYGLSRYESNRSGYDADTSKEIDLMCGDATDPSDFIESSSLSRPGNNWVYAWRNPTSETSKLPDGGVTVVVWGRDRGEFRDYKGEEDKKRENHGAATAMFTLDSKFKTPLDPSGGDVQPDPGSDVDEPRPFVLLDFAGERTSVEVTKLTMNGDDVLSSLDSVGDNRFLYWPETLDYGEHTVVFDARDAADNKIDGAKFSFDVTARDPFVLDIVAGWNAVSFPADPVDSAPESVFTEFSIDRVVGWNPMSSTGPWSIASRTDGVWTTSDSFAPLNEVTARYGYWVHSSAFVLQSVDLVGPLNRETGGRPMPKGIPTIPGWNFVGVVDQDGDQTEGHFGNDLKDSEDTVVTAKDYMPGYVRAYTWDAIKNGYRILEGDQAVKIGDGIWVYFPGDGIAP